MALKYLIVEDEERARETLLMKIGFCKTPDITCVGTASTANEAILLSRLQKPDFLFLDINLPGANGFELLEMLRKEGITPEVIFTSAHTENDILLAAIKEFPICFLLKPINIDDLEKAIVKVALHLDKNSGKKEAFYGERVAFLALNGPLYLPVEAVMMIKADINNTILYSYSGERKKLADNLGMVEKKVETYDFLKKLDRSTIVNLNYVTQILPKKQVAILRYQDVVFEAPLAVSGINKLKEILNPQEKR